MGQMFSQRERVRRKSFLKLDNAQLPSNKKLDLKYFFHLKDTITIPKFSKKRLLFLKHEFLSEAMVKSFSLFNCS